MNGEKKKAGRKKTVLSLVLLVACAILVALAWIDGTVEESGLWIDRFLWMIAFMPFFGVLLAGFTNREDPEIQGEKVLRHDSAAIAQHWTHGVGTFMLIVSGCALGFFFIPNLLSVAGTRSMMNVHFVGMLAFLFGTFYYLGNSIRASKRVREHLPTKNFWPYTKAHYGTLLGSKKTKMPPEKKYFESEKMAYILAVGASVLVILSGFFKSAAHAFDLPDALMGFMTNLHDVAAIMMILFFVAHVFFAAIAPGTGPILRSMLTGYISLETVKKEHGGWYEELTGEKSAKGDTAKEIAEEDRKER